jgi:hypothetical protein
MDPLMDEPLVETWMIHNRINLYLLDAIADEALGATLNGKGRSVRDQFVHLHNVHCVAFHPTRDEGLETLQKLHP